MKLASCVVASALLWTAGGALAAYDFPAGVAAGHSPVGHYYGNWTTDSPDLLVNYGGDKAVAWKDFPVSASDLLAPVMLYIGCDDGARAWVNGTLVLDAPYDAHGVGFWNYGLDITAYLTEGRNRLTIAVWNSCQGGSGEGGLDFEVSHPAHIIVPSGYFDGWSEANALFVDGGACGWEPAADSQGRNFTHRDYGWLEESVDAHEQVQSFSLEAAYPNPFNPGTTLSYSLAATAEVRLSVVNLVGQEVALLVNGLQEAGSHQVRFNAANLPSGLYLARLEAAGQARSTKLVLMK